MKLSNWWNIWLFGYNIWGEFGVTNCWWARTFFVKVCSLKPRRTESIQYTSAPIPYALPGQYSKLMFCRSIRDCIAYANKVNTVNKHSPILCHLLKRKLSKSRFSGKTNFDKQQHYNIGNVPRGVYGPLSPRGHGLKKWRKTWRCNVLSWYFWIFWIIII